MFSFQLLPAALVALMYASPALSAPTSKNDPFRAIALHIPPKSDMPICCLRPLPPLEPVEGDVLLSFEEWKVKQSAVQDQAKTKEQDTFNHSAQTPPGEVARNGGNESELASVVVRETAGGPLEADDPNFLPSLAVSPHFRVPLTDRFNYANLDCSARVHLSHRSAKSSSSILSSKRDRYMLSPCNTPNKEQQFVVVELCEDIRIDTVQLANFEFFSGVFKDFTVSVAKTYTTDGEGWTTAGTYRAKNIRGVQSFHPPTSLRDFYRYIRIDFLSHYGNEFYCPVSLLRVYGLTHLEEWKWETWEAESRAKLDVSAKADAQSLVMPANVSPDPSAQHTHSPEVIIEGNIISTLSMNDSSTSSEDMFSITSISMTTTASTTDSVPVVPLPTLIKTGSTGILSIYPVGTTDGQASTPESVGIVDHTLESPIPAPDAYVATGLSSASAVIDQPNGLSSSDTVQVSSSSETLISIGDPSSILSTASYSTTLDSSSSISSSSVITSASTTAITSTAASVAVSIAVAPPPIAIPTGGESIYRTIMNRLTALEANHTLYARYVEQQTSGVREMLRRLGEDVGRLEGIGRAQAQMYQRTVHEWERRQHRLQMEYGELMSRVEYLSDEIVLEKRLGIAQLCLLLAVLVFMGLTRGSRGESFMEHAPGQFNRSMREWSKRHLSFSGDWTSRFKGKSRSRSVAQNSIKPHPQPSMPLPQTLDANGGAIQFPSEDPWKKEPLGPSRINTSLNDAFLQAHENDSPSQTPSQRTARGRHHHPQHQHNTRPATPTSSFRSQPALQRSSSQGVAHYPSGRGSPAHASAPRSARRWARTAHLHEVKSDAQTRSPRTHRRDDLLGQENETVDVFSTPATVPRVPRGRLRHDLSIMVDDRKGGPVQLFDPTPLKNKEAEGDPWEDTDLDVGESEEDIAWEAKADTARAGVVPGKEH